MSNPDDKASPYRTLRNMMKSLNDEELEEDVSSEEANADLRAMGVDPVETGKRGGAFARALLEKRRQAWQAESDANLARVRALYDAIPPIPPAPRDVLLKMLARRRQGLGSQVAVGAFRQRSVEEASEEELREMIRDTDALRRLADLPPIDDDSGDQ